MVIPSGASLPVLPVESIEAYKPSYKRFALEKLWKMPKSMRGRSVDK